MSGIEEVDLTVVEVLDVSDFVRPWGWVSVVDLEEFAGCDRARPGERVRRKLLMRVVTGSFWRQFLFSLVVFGSVLFGGFVSDCGFGLVCGLRP